MERCKTCAHFEPGEVVTRVGSCRKWIVGYGYGPDDIADDGCVVEGDEGWGMLIGENFGCVLHEPKPNLTLA